MTLTGDTGVRFSELEQPELAEYRPVNRFAFFAFIVGWLSALALAHLVFCVLPLTGVVVSLMALRQLNNSELKQSGRQLAILGLGLSLLFGSWAISRESSRELRMYEQSQRFAEEWFELLRNGKLQEAHQLTLPEETRAAAGVALADHYAQHSHDKDSAATSSSKGSSDPANMMEMMSHPHFEFDSFFAQPLVKKLRDLGSTAHYKFRERVQFVDTAAATSEMELLFDVTDEREGSKQTFPIRIALARTYRPGVAADWRVVRVVDHHSN